MGIELELFVLLAIQTLGMSVFAVFEIETAIWRKLLKWTVLIGVTLGLYSFIGHWSLVVPLLGVAAGAAVHVIFCRKHGIHPIRATPRRKYYGLRGWEWPG